MTGQEPCSGQEPCKLHGEETCLRCMPPDEYYRWQMAHDQIGLFYLPGYWAARDRHRAAGREAV